MLVSLELVFHLFMHFIFHFNVIIWLPSNVNKLLLFQRRIICLINNIKRTLSWQVWNTFFFLQMLNSFNLLSLKHKISTVTNFRCENTVRFGRFRSCQIDLLVIVLWTRILVVFIVASWVFVVT